MNRNSYAGMSALPIVNHPRSKFNIRDRKRLTGNIGEIHCHFLKEVLPGDTFRITDSEVIRLQTLTVPFMDDIYQDTYYFYVPNRIIWAKWKNFQGESEGAWYDDDVELTIPQIKCPEGGWAEGSLADDFGIPTQVDNIEVSALPFRAYALIFNEYFRSTVLQDSLYIPIGEATQQGVNTLSDYVNDIANGAIAIACKLPDIFTLATPAPQRGPAVTLSIGELTGKLTGAANVVGNGKTLGLTDGERLTTLFRNNPGSFNNLISTSSNTFGSDVGTMFNQGSFVGNEIEAGRALGVPTKEQLNSPLNADYTGLVADMELGNASFVTQGASLVSINELRTAFQIQKYFEKLAVAGNRMVEQIKALFGVNVPDYRVSRPEYLGGKRIRLNHNQVVQTSSTDTTTPQGNVAAYSLTADSSFVCEKSFVEAGYVLGLTVLRYENSYQQGIPATFLRKTKFDFYTPLLQSIGEVGMKNALIYAQGSEAINEETGKAYDDEIFGYQEAWFDYRYGSSTVAGEMRSINAQSLDMWHFGDFYESLPQLSPEWIGIDKTNVDRALAVGSTVANQYFMDITVDTTAVRVMPIHSIPGNIDHYA